MTLAKMLDRAASARAALEAALDRIDLLNVIDEVGPSDRVGPAEALDMLVYRDVHRAIAELTALEQFSPASDVAGTVIIDATVQVRAT